ncbi:MAG TPA: hypothetical protein VIE65_00435 [Methylobacter sp.]|jgi:succinate dehydrogenase hydrophobic anchor subunit
MSPRIKALLVFAFLLVIPAYAMADDKKCDGPPELCAQIQDLNQKISVLKNQKNKDVAVAVQQNQQQTANQISKLIAIAGTISVVLKLLLSALSSWKDYFQTDKGKAWLKVITVGVGLIAFIASNVGMGIPFWQAIILAAGGPAAMAVHSIWQMIPVIAGKQKMPPSIPPGPDQPAAA